MDIHKRFETTWAGHFLKTWSKFSLQIISQVPKWKMLSLKCYSSAKFFSYIKLSNYCPKVCFSVRCMVEFWNSNQLMILKICTKKNTIFWSYCTSNNHRSQTVSLAYLFYKISWPAGTNFSALIQTIFLAHFYQSSHFFFLKIMDVENYLFFKF